MSRPALVPTCTAVHGMRLQEFFPEEKRPEREVNCSSPSSAKVKKEWSYTCISPARLHGMDRESFTFYLLPYDTVFLCNIPDKSGMLLDVLQLCFSLWATIEMWVQVLIHSQSDIWTRLKNKRPTWCHSLLSFISLFLCSTCFGH